MSKLATTSASAILLLILSLASLGQHVVISPDGRTLAGDDNGEITLWEIAHGKELRTFKAQTSYAYVYAIAFTPDGQTLVSFSQRGRGSELNPDQTIRLWDIASGKELRKLQVPHNYAEWSSRSFTSSAFSLDGKLLGVVTEIDDDHAADVYVYEVASGKELWYSMWAHGMGGSAAFSRDAQMLASGKEKVTLWDVATGKELRTLEVGPYHDANGYHHYSVRAIAFSPDGKTLASASGFDDNNIKLWDIASGKELRTLRGHVDAGFSLPYPPSAFSLAFSPNGRKLASGGDDKVVRLWDVATGKELFTLRGHSNTIFSVAFTPDGNTLVSGSSDDTIKLWNVANGKELRTLRRSASGFHTVSAATRE